MFSSDLVKTREICFNITPKGQAGHAMLLLTGLAGLEIRLSPHKNAILITYNLSLYILEELESALIAQGFHLDNSLLQKIKRAVIYFSEQVQRENIEEPEREHKSKQVFVQSYQHHPHGDHDPTPREWREYR